MIPYTLIFIGSGLLIDRYRTKLIYGVAAVWWSIASMLHEVVGSFLGFSTARFLLGTAESANFVGAHNCWKTNLVTLTADIFPRSVVGSVHGIVATGGGIGGALFTSIAGIVIDKFSYTPLLITMGVLHPLAYLCVRWLVKGEAISLERL